MKTITALKAQQHNRRRINIYLDGTFAFGLALNQADNLRVGQELTLDEIVGLRAADEIEKAFVKAVNFLSHRPRTDREVQRRLAKVTSDPDVINAVMVRLREAKMVDDEAFAKFWVENRTTFRPRGCRALRSELRQKGIAPEIIEESVANFDETTAATDAARRRAPRLSNLPIQEFRQKLRSFLGRRGFNYDVIAMVVDETIRDQIITNVEG